MRVRGSLCLVLFLWGALFGTTGHAEGGVLQNLHDPASSF